MTQKNDDMKTALGDLGLTGSLPERMYKHLASLGHTQLSISDRMGQVGGFKTYQNSVLTSVPLPVIEYLVLIGSSTMVESFSLNDVLGRQEQLARQAMTAAGIDVPIINKAVSGNTIGTTKANINTYISQLGSPTKVCGFVINIGSNDIGQTSYEAMAGATKTSMETNLRDIITAITSAGHIPILGTSNSREGFAELYEGWADNFYRPLCEELTPDWFDSPLAVFDYSRLYFENKDVVDWWQDEVGGGVHPQLAAAGMQQYTAERLAATSSAPAIATNQRVIIHFPIGAKYIGGINSLIASGATGNYSTIVDFKGNVISGATFSWSGATGGSGGSRGNAGVYDVGVTHHDVQSSSVYRSAGTATFTANFGVAYASLTGTAHFTANSSTANRFTRVTIQGESDVIAASSGVPVISLPFTLDASGVVTFTIAPEAPSTFANLSGVEFDFD